MRLWRLLFLPPLCLFAVGCQPLGPEGDVAAVVNGYKITYDELEKYYRSQVEEMGDPPSDDQAHMLRLNVLREVIDRQIMLQKAAEKGLIAVDSEVDAKLNEYKAPYDTEEEFQQHLAERGMTLGELRAELRRQLTVEKFLNREITSKIDITKGELREYYEENRGSFNVPEQQLHLAQIVVTARSETPVPNLRNDDATDMETARAKIQMIEQRLKKGDDFATLAQNYSEDPVSTPNGGDLGFVTQSSLEKADIVLRRVVASLSPGEISPVVKTDDEFRILKLISVEPAGQRDFEAPRVQQTIRENLRNRKDQLLKTAYLEVARNEAKVKNFYAQRIVREFGAGG